MSDHKGGVVLEFDFTSGNGKKKKAPPPKRLAHQDIASSQTPAYLKPSCENTLRAAMEFCVEDTSMPFAIPPLAASMFALCGMGDTERRILAGLCTVCRLHKDGCCANYYEFSQQMEHVLDYHSSDLLVAAMRLGLVSPDDHDDRYATVLEKTQEGQGEETAAVDVNAVTPRCFRIMMLSASMTERRHALSCTLDQANTGALAMLLDQIDAVTSEDMQRCFARVRYSVKRRSETDRRKTLVFLLNYLFQRRPEKRDRKLKLASFLDYSIREDNPWAIPVLLAPGLVPPQCDLSKESVVTVSMPGLHPCNRFQESHLKRWISARSPLMRAIARKCSLKTIDALLDSGCDVNALEYVAEANVTVSPLMLAVFVGVSQFPAVFNTLIAHGADISVPVPSDNASTVPLHEHRFFPAALRPTKQ